MKNAFINFIQTWAVMGLVVPSLAQAGKFEEAKKKAEEAARVAYEQTLTKESAAAIQSVWRGLKTRRQISNVNAELMEMRDVRLQLKAEAEEYSKEAKECPICQDEFSFGEKAKKLGCACKALYHPKCIADHQASRGVEAMCPMGREPISSMTDVVLASERAIGLMGRLNELESSVSAKLNPSAGAAALVVSAAGASVDSILRGYSMIHLPAVTVEDVDHLTQAGVETSIRETIPAFKIANAVTSIGLYHAVMGRYPDLTQLGYLPENQRAEILRNWQENPDLPLTYTTLAEDQTFVAELNRQTGRHFYIPTQDQVEYAIRGRAGGNITTTKYHFGDTDAEVYDRAFVAENPLSQLQAHGVHEVPAGQEAQYMNSFGLIHAIGNVSVRSSDGVIRGGAFNCYGYGAMSSLADEGRADIRGGDIGFRLAED